jgi:hypothetical protein
MSIYRIRDWSEALYETRGAGAREEWQRRPLPSARRTPPGKIAIRPACPASLKIFPVNCPTNTAFQPTNPALDMPLSWAPRPGTAVFGTVSARRAHTNALYSAPI